MDIKNIDKIYMSYYTKDTGSSKKAKKFDPNAYLIEHNKQREKELKTTKQRSNNYMKSVKQNTKIKFK